MSAESGLRSDEEGARQLHISAPLSSTGENTVDSYGNSKSTSHGQPCTRSITDLQVLTRG